MSVPPISALASLDRSCVHLFVAGPGVGEGIGVALPGAGWIMVDCCRQPGTTEVPIVDLYFRLRSGVDDRVELAVLTHPHQDHVLGFPELLERVDPVRLGVAGPGASPHANLFDEARAALSPAEDTDAETLQASVLSAMQAIKMWTLPGRVVTALHDGQSVDVPNATVSCRAPDVEGLAAFFDAGTPGDLARRLRKQANELSVVIEIECGDARLVLGGDLPTTASRPGAAATRTGWNTVMSAHGHLGDHTALKIPHHGSVYARHDRLMAISTRPRRWVCTPFKGMPEPTEAAVGSLLAAEAEIYLTARPSSWPAHPRGTRRVPFEGLRAGSRPSFGDPLVDAGRVTRPVVSDSSTDPIWAFELGTDGTPRRRWAGDAALLLTRE